MRLTELLANNRAWAANIVKDDKDFFNRLSDQQAPKYLWIGCSDSRVPANQIIGLLPGDIFVHRNVANLVVHTDLNCLSVIQYAVEVLKVEHIIVCGHYGCGGVQATVLRRDFGLVNNWLRHLADVRDQHATELETLANDDARVARLVELNVLEQVRNVCESTIVLDRWKAGGNLTVHGWAYGIRDGLINDLLSASVSSERDLGALRLR